MGKETLREVLDGAKSDLVKTIHNVADATERALNNGDLSSPIIPAALHMISELAGAGNKIFSQELPVSTDKETVVEEAMEKRARQREVNQNVPEKPDQKNKDGQGPTTFEELLELRIDNELLEKDKEKIGKQELLDLLGRDGAHGRHIQRLLVIQGLDPNEQEFGKDRAIGIIKSVLMSHKDKKGAPRETYTKTELMQIFRMSAAQLNIWGEKIGYDFKSNPTLDRKTALAIKGLFALDRLLGLVKLRKPLQKA